MKPRTVPQRAESYAVGKSRATSVTGVEGLAMGWEDGYRAALRDVNKVAASLVDDVCGELQQALLNVVTRAGTAFKQEMEKIK